MPPKRPAVVPRSACGAARAARGGGNRQQRRRQARRFGASGLDPYHRRGASRAAAGGTAWRDGQPRRGFGAGAEGLGPEPSGARFIPSIISLQFSITRLICAGSI